MSCAPIAGYGPSVRPSVRPVPGTRVIEGRVLVPHDPRVQPRVVLRRESGGPISGRLLTGRMRVAGVLPAAEGRFAPPPRRSAVLTIFAPDGPPGRAARWA
jgi:hypothetical protein